MADGSPVSQRSPHMRPVEQNKPALNPETGTVSGKYKVRDEFMPKKNSIHKEVEKESVTDPFCGIRIM